MHKERNISAQEKILGNPGVRDIKEKIHVANVSVATRGGSIAEVFY